MKNPGSPSVHNPVATAAARRAALSVMMLAGLAAPASAHDGASAPQSAPAAAAHDVDPATLIDPLTGLSGNPDEWSVSTSEVGCYLMSPRRLNTSSLAIGRHPRLGTGLFILNFGLSVPRTNTGEIVTIQAAGTDLNRTGRIAGVRLFFVPLDTADIDASLLALKQTGMLGLLVRKTWIAHGGQKVAEAIAQYRQAGCSAAGPDGAKPGS